MKIASCILALAAAASVQFATVAEARPRPHVPHVPRQHPSVAPTPVVPANVHFAPAGTIPLPGRGLTLAWAPDGSAIAAGGHFKDPATGQRYDTRLLDVTSATLRPAS